MRRIFLLIALVCVLPRLTLADELNIEVELGGIGHELAYDSARQLIYVTVPSLNEVVYLSAESFEVVDRVVVGSQPKGIDLNHDGSKLFVALYGAGSIAVVDLDTQAVSEIVIGDELGDHRTWDVIEAQPNRLFATANPSSSGFAWVVEVLLDPFASATRVASNRIIRAGPVLAQSPDQRFLYVGEGFSPNSLYKLDLSVPDAPIILEDNHGSVSGTSYLQVSPDGARIHTSSGQVLRTGSFIQAGTVDPGIVRYGDDPRSLFVAVFPGFADSSDTTRIQEFDATTYVAGNTRVLNCPVERFARFADFLVLPGDQGFLILSQDTVCGVVGDSGALDMDGDGVIDSSDNCPIDYNPLQENLDGDNEGDICDPYPADSDNLQACMLEASACDASVAILESEIGALESVNSGLRQEISQLESEVSRLESEIESIKATIDTDADGVPDVEDICPGTKSVGRGPDEQGCRPDQRRGMK